MGKICTVSGCIFGDDVSENVKLIQALPLDDEWPKLTKNMFAVSSSNYETPGFYKLQMIHFGASIKYLDEDWDIWLAKFELLLSKLTWREAYAVLTLEWPAEGYDSRRYDYRWKSVYDVGVQDWVFEGGPRVFSNSPIGRIS